MATISFFIIAFLFGFQHAFEADHLAAVFLMRKGGKKSAVLRGAYWGAGHSITLIILAVLVILFQQKIPEALSSTIEFIVAAGLILFGARMYFTGRHVHAASFLVGMLHGIAGSAGLMLLALSSAKSGYLALAYVAIFGIGSILGMILASLGISAVQRYAKTYANIITGVFAIIAGVLVFV